MDTELIESRGEKIDRLFFQSLNEILTSNNNNVSLQESYNLRRARIKALLAENPSIRPYEIAVIENGSKHFAQGSLGGKISRIKATIKLLIREQSIIKTRS